MIWLCRSEMCYVLWDVKILDSMNTYFNEVSIIWKASWYCQVLYMYLDSMHDLFDTYLLHTLLWIPLHLQMSYIRLGVVKASWWGHARSQIVTNYHKLSMLRLFGKGVQRSSWINELWYNRHKSLRTFGVEIEDKL